MHQEEASRDIWFAGAATVIGADHKKKNTPCQDRHGWKSLPGGTFIAAVSDGAGSRPRSGEGAELVVERALTGLEILANDPPATASEWESAMRGLFVDAWEALSDLADAELVDISEFNATLSCIIVTPDVCVVGQIGDGAIVLDVEPDGLTLPIPPENGEYANSTYFINRLTNHDRHVHVRVLGKPIRGIGLITDGLGDYTLTGPQRDPEPRASFWQVFFDRMSAAVGTEDQSPRIRGLLASNKIQETFTDDLTLILAVPTAGVHTLTGIDDLEEPAGVAPAVSDEAVTAESEPEPTPGNEAVDDPDHAAIPEAGPPAKVDDVAAKHDDAAPESLPGTVELTANPAIEDTANPAIEDTATTGDDSTPVAPDTDEIHAGETADSGQGEETPDRDEEQGIHGIVNIDVAATEEAAEPDEKADTSDTTAVRPNPPQEPDAQGLDPAHAEDNEDEDGHEPAPLPQTLYLHDLDPGARLGSGGEATVRDLPGIAGHAIKCFNRPVSSELEDKLEWMVANPPAGPVRERLTWPLALVRDDRDNLVGYVMRQLPEETVPLSYVLGGDKAHIYKTLKREPFTLRDMHLIAWNLAATVRACHQEGYVIVDLHHGSFHVSAKGHVFLIDNDSFQIRESNGTLYPCNGVAVLEYHSPELKSSVSAGHVEPTHDAFVLSILIFRLLMDSVHPFRGSTDFADADGPPDESDLMKRGLYPYDTGRLNEQVQPHRRAPALARLHEDVVSGFQQSFTQGMTHPEWRTTPQDWLRVLETAVPALGRCQRGHWYSTDRRCCLTKGGNGLYCGASTTARPEPIPEADIDPLTGESRSPRSAPDPEDAKPESAHPTWPAASVAPNAHLPERGEASREIGRTAPVPDASTLEASPEEETYPASPEPGRAPMMASAKRFLRRFREQT